MRIVYHRGALRDLEAIHSYIAREDARVAGQVVERIRQAANRLENLPYSGRPGPRGIRLLSVPGLPYVVIHRVRAAAVTIVAVFHTSRNRRF